MSIVFSIPASAATGDQFDLVCTGTRKDALSAAPMTNHYHLDLKAGQWCANECPMVRSFAEVAPLVIVFDEQKAAYNDDRSARLDFVRRDSGYWGLSEYGIQVEGKCEPAPFSGFHAAKAKF